MNFAHIPYTEENINSLRTSKPIKQRMQEKNIRKERKE